MTDEKAEPRSSDRLPRAQRTPLPPALRAQFSLRAVPAVPAADKQLILSTPGPELVDLMLTEDGKIVDNRKWRLPDKDLPSWVYPLVAAKKKKKDDDDVDMENMDDDDDDYDPNAESKSNVQKAKKKAFESKHVVGPGDIVDVRCNHTDCSVSFTIKLCVAIEPPKKKKELFFF